MMSLFTLKKIKLSGKPKSFLLKLFFEISILSILLVSLISFVLYRNYIKESTNTISIYNQKLLLQTCSNFDFMDKYIRRFAESINANSKATYLMTYKEEDILTMTQYIDDIDDIIFNIAFVNSIYLYNSNKSSFFCMGDYSMIRNRSDMYDKEIIDILDHIDEKKIVGPIARKIPFSGYVQDKMINVYTYILYTLDKNNKISDALVINANATYLFDNLFSTARAQFGEKTSMIVMDKSGTVYGHSQGDLFKTNISNLDYIKKIQTSNNSSGFFNWKIDHMSSVVNYQYLSDSDLVFIVITPNQHIIDFLNKIKLTSVILCLCAILLGLLLSYILSLNFYTPVKNLYKNVKEFLATSEPSSSSADKKNEFEFISNTISDMSGKMNTLEYFKSSSIDIVKERYLSNLLTGSPDSLETIKEKFKQYNVQINPDNKFIMIILKIDRYSDFIKQFDQTQLSEIRHQFNMLVYEYLSDVSIYDCINFDNDQTILLVSMKEPDLRKTILVNLIREIQRTTSEKHSLSISAAISDSSANITNIKMIYTNTLNLLQYRIVYGYSCILTSDLLDEVKIENIIFHTNLVKSLVDSIKSESRENVKKYHKEFFAYITPYSPENIRYGLSYLSVNVFDVLHVIENNSTTVFNVSFMDFNNRINTFETLEEISQCFLSLYEQIILTIEENRESKSDLIFNTVKKHITANYTDRNLSLTSVAEVLNMNPVYLGKQFKNTNFKSISEYINEVRMAKAVDLMQGSSYTIDEILEKVGWESKKYFFAVFKKHYGVTPNEYRLSNNIKHISG